MASHSMDKSAAYRIANICIILILAYCIFIIAIFLRATSAVCSTTAPGVVLSIAFVSAPVLAVPFQANEPGFTIDHRGGHSMSSHDPQAGENLPEDFTLHHVPSTGSCLCSGCSMPRPDLGHPCLRQFASGSKSTRLSRQTPSRVEDERSGRAELEIRPLMPTAPRIGGIISDDGVRSVATINP
jgi:hypothetical protein